MKLKQWLDQWSLKGLKISAGFLEMEWGPEKGDRDAAWELYVELLTRTTTQYLSPSDGDEATALSSVHALFGITRSILKTHGRHCNQFAKIAIVVLNQVVRPFTAKWHRESLQDAFADQAKCQQFRQELKQLQENLREFTRMLADTAGVEDLTNLEADA